jgi:hypothetical protein
MNRLTAIADKEKGKRLIMLQRQKFESALEGLPEGRYFLTLEKIYSKRTDQQRKAQFAIPYRIIRECIIDSTGEEVSKEWIYEFCKKRFLPQDYVEKLKEEWKEKRRYLNGLNKKRIYFPFKLTTTKMNTVQQNQYYMNMQLFAAEFWGVEIPEPDKDWKNKLQ